MPRRAQTESQRAMDRTGYAHGVRDWHAREFTINPDDADRSYRRGYTRAVRHCLRDAYHGRTTPPA